MLSAMETSDARNPTGMGISFRQQALLLGVSGRWVYLILGLVALLLLVGLSDIPRDVSRMLIVAQLALLAGVTWAVMVWFGEGPDRRGYHWSLPVHRPGHDLARVAAGAAYLLGICVVLAGAGAIAASVNGTFDRFVAVGPEAWANFFLTPLIVYLLVIPVVLWSDYAVTRWVFGITLGTGLLSAILGWQGFHLPGNVMRTVFEAEQWGLGAALFDWTVRVFGPAPVDAKWMAAAFWLAAGLVLTGLTALYRPDDIRRRARGS